jgi:hypothetical protein
MSFDIVGGRPGGSGPYSCRLEHITPLPDLRSRDERSPLFPAGKLLVGGSFLGVTQPGCSCASPSGRSCERAHAASRIATCYRPTTESHTPRPRRPGPRNTACWVWRAPKHGLLGSLVPPFPSPPDHEDRITGSAPCDQFEPTRRSVHSTSGPHGHVHRFQGGRGRLLGVHRSSSAGGRRELDDRWGETALPEGHRFSFGANALSVTQGPACVEAKRTASGTRAQPTPRPRWPARTTTPEISSARS